jgi:hypothetical protein
MTRRRWHVAAGVAALLIAAGVAAAVVLAFTGDSRASPTKAEYFAGVTKICRAYGPRLDAIAPLSDVTVPGEVVTALQRVIPIIQAETTEVRALEPPEELAAEVEHWLVLKDRVLATLERALAAAKAPNIPQTAYEYLHFLTVARQTSKLGGEIGFPRICSSSG